MEGAHAPDTTDRRAEVTRRRLLHLFTMKLFKCVTAGSFGEMFRLQLTTIKPVEGQHALKRRRRYFIYFCLKLSPRVCVCVADCASSDKTLEYNTAFYNK